MMFAKVVSQTKTPGEKPGRVKPIGRKLALPTKKQIVDKVSKPKVNKPKPESRRPQQNNRRPSSNEDRLLDLVDKQ